MFDLSKRAVILTGATGDIAEKGAALRPSLGDLVASPGDENESAIPVVART